MKYIFLFLLLLFLSGLVVGQEQTCFTPPQVAPIAANLNPDPLNGNYCVTVYVEVDNDIVVERGGVTPATIYIEGLLDEVATLYQADGISLNFITYYWETQSPYQSGTSGGMLDQFRTYRANNGGHDGDVAMLLSYQASGGIAYVDVICRGSFGYSFSSIRNTYRDYPIYSWSVEVIAHELGHNLGSPHTQNCVWNGDNTAIDGCSPFGVVGGCDDPGLPVNGGTIMSYCHLNGSVGINFQKGFHPQPLALIKNRIANAQCVECVDGPDDPEPETCDSNQIIVEVQLDNYPQETSWQVLNGDGAIMGASQPYGKLQMNTYHTDTLCLPDGCYTFVITDIDGIEGYGCGEGLYIVNGPNGELASGQSFTNEETTTFCLGVTPPDGDCQDVAIRADDLTDYANQSRFPFVTVTDIPGGVEVYGNNWRALAYEYEITPFTTATLDFGNLNTGEIQGIAFVDNINGIWPNRSFRFSGTQSWGIPFDAVAEGETKTITIPVGQYFTGGITHIVLISDDDVRGVVRSTWANLELCESDGAELVNKSGLMEAQGTAEDENWSDNRTIEGHWIAERARALRPYPNPVTDTLTLPIFAAWELYAISGQRVLSGSTKTVNMGDLKAGVYFIHQNGSVDIIIKR